MVAASWSRNSRVTSQQSSPTSSVSSPDMRQSSPISSPSIEAQARPKSNAWEWECGICTFVNRPCFNPCEMCGFPRGSQPEEEQVPSRGDTALSGRAWGTDDRNSPPANAGQELLAALKGGQTKPDEMAGRKILAALKSNEAPGPSELLLAALKGGPQNQNMPPDGVPINRGNAGDRGGYSARATSRWSDERAWHWQSRAR
eukprot:CAMPEP_0197651266 /NCGR_PEP_ID=MMETSP1338-20131121/31743_1 /TAXON_ID=43686 ORGANISM="Pelagodinium beii, Strain RCC1491" /NCGR_SAMPLE_ID=MMETSP1338 /ASSEMBLY_ACC=CAM_ASM_000754 /LENGTH=200 /DNA_ID=CAMNT_0043225849 /DNA_START=54 /DNA_END=656 /DNA_ORIENTATION=-